MTDEVTLSLDEAFELSVSILEGAGFSAGHADAIARNIVAVQGDECHSHGLYRLLVCTRSVREGKAVPDAQPVIRDDAPGIVRVDAGYGFSLLGFEAGLPALLDKARRAGLAALVINRCYHFSALWPEVEAIARAGLACLVMTPSFTSVAPAGGNKPLMGTNPIAFGWPRADGEQPFVFDFATSVIARGDIELHRRAGRTIPEGWAIDAEGRPTSDAAAALQGAMLAFGGHKGSALSMMVELLAGALIGDNTSPEASLHDAGAGVTPCHGELILAFDPDRFSGDAGQWRDRAEGLFRKVLEQGARLPSQRRYEARKRSAEHGVRISRELYAELTALPRRRGKAPGRKGP